MTSTYYSKSENDTIEIGRRISSSLIEGDIITLDGNLGSGKTQLVKGICKGLDYDYIALSPSFSIVNIYKAKMDIYHFDFYRINKIDELYEIGYDEYLNENGIVIIEWANLFPQVIPKAHRTINIEFGKNKNDRIINID